MKKSRETIPLSILSHRLFFGGRQDPYKMGPLFMVSRKSIIFKIVCKCIKLGN